MCENYSWHQICKNCQDLYLKPQIYKKKLDNGIDVISFYKYDEIKDLLFTKHTDLGYYIYKILANNSFKKFAEEFHTKERFVSIGIDDRVKQNYSHTAILNRSLKTYNIKPIFTKLHAQNEITYSSKSRAFRKANPRNFKFKNFKETNVILVDDIKTTGSTLLEASNLLQKHNKEIAFCLTLVDLS